MPCTGLLCAILSTWSPNRPKFKANVSNSPPAPNPSKKSPATSAPNSNKPANGFSRPVSVNSLTAACWASVRAVAPPELATSLGAALPVAAFAALSARDLLTFAAFAVSSLICLIPDKRAFCISKFVRSCCCADLAKAS